MRVRSAVREVARRAAERHEREYQAVEYVKTRTGQTTDEWASWIIKTDTGFEVHVQRIPKNGQHYIFLYSDDGTYDGVRGNAP